MLKKIMEAISKTVSMPSVLNFTELIRLSPTMGLNIFDDCPACFWRMYREGKPRPRGIVASLNNGLDLLIKDYFDKHRGRLPSELIGTVKGKLIPDQKLINKWRHWSTGLKFKLEDLSAELFGAMDDCSICNGKYFPIDYKCRGFPPKEGQSEKYYQTQLDSYALMLDSNGFPAGKYGYLVYYYPIEVNKNAVIKFKIEIKRLTVNILRAKQKFEDAVKCLRSSMKPKRNESCEYCKYLVS